MDFSSSLDLSDFENEFPHIKSRFFPYEDTCPGSISSLPGPKYSLGRREKFSSISVRFDHVIFYSLPGLSHPISNRFPPFEVMGSFLMGHGGFSGIIGLINNELRGIFLYYSSISLLI
jgi:hypothetical protein